MKRITTLLTLVAIIISAESFKAKHPHTSVNQFKNDGFLVALVDGKPFAIREENKYTAQLANKTYDIYARDPKLTRVANTISFYGNDFKDEDENLFNESIGFEYTFNEGALGEANGMKIVMDYNNQKFYNVSTETKIKITKIEWSADRRNFVMNADFDCKMRKWGVPVEKQPVLKLKGKMENITVSVPSWVVIKNPNQVASGQ